MSDTVTLVILANSRKPPHGGRCVAGKAISGVSFGEWIRPVSSRASHEISDEERRYENGVYAQLLDIVKIPVVGRHHLYHQTENVIIDSDYYWEKLGRSSFQDVRSAVDQPRTLWNNGDSTYHGFNDRVQLADAASYRGSLYLIEPQNLRIVVRMESQYAGPARRRVRAIFEYRKEHYKLIFTDPEIEQKLLAGPDAEYPLIDVYLSISLSEPNTGGDGACYKLAAALIGNYTFPI